ncbi:deleted in malignant brain tumors 1 protein [Lingula anatina]|uniref:Deleted in malignant brain tumors 1 protein n=1 Tax=Lingula anatina TaxID=7574 RepID=A0A1S3INQ6_LINAN|nr:deleted in malignant brain tumors 1 protein [Lingula anatina]|eukprot:XP_013399708.2 deleted in malignant brain tumors 1 protein [Lingula anatina]
MTCLRLVGGSVAREGRVEIYYLGQWGTVCDSDWNIRDGQVTCRMLGYSDAVAVYPSARFGQGNGTLMLSHINCTGTESSLEECDKPLWVTTCSYYQDASVRCKDPGLASVECTFEADFCGYNQSYSNNLNWVRSQGYTYYSNAPGSDHTLDSSYGYYIYMSGSNGRPNETARITSPVIKVNTSTVYNISFWFYMRGRELGYIRVLVKRSETMEQELWNFTAVTGSYSWLGHFLHISTSSDFQVIFEGVRGGDSRSTIALDDIFICPVKGNTTLVPVTVSVRLAGGYYPWDGRVEIYHAGVWGDICGSGWDIYDAQVVCRMLGYRGVDAAYTHSGMWLYSSVSRTWLSDVDCVGFEYSLEYCTHSRWGFSYCFGSTMAGVRCTPPENANTTIRSNVTCSFESGSCAFQPSFENLSTSYNWSVISGSTPSSGTGPYTDHTLGTLSGHYIYAEASSVSRGANTILISPPLEPRGRKSYNVSFWYHMHGNDMGALNIRGRSLSSSQIIFEAICGSGFRSDVALDDISIVPIIRHYLYARNTYGTGAVARYISPPLANNTRYIVSFWYMFPSFYRSALRVLVHGTERDVRWSNSGYSDITWRYGYFILTMSRDFQIVFEASLLSSSSAYIAVDDINIARYTGSMTTLMPTPSVNSSNVRLVGGVYAREGRVEVFYQGRWGTVCDDGWDLRDALVVCRWLGYFILHSVHTYSFIFSDADAAYDNARFGAGSGPIWLDEVSCTGEENSLWECRHPSAGNHDCSHSEDAGVRCSGQTTTVRPTVAIGTIPSVVCANTTMNQPLARTCAQFVVCGGLPYLASCGSGFWFSKKTRTCVAFSTLSNECYPSGSRKPGNLYHCYYQIL